jgi:hypothetical protein
MGLGMDYEPLKRMDLSKSVKKDSDMSDEPPFVG